MEGPMGLEPMTPCLKGRCSNQLSYGPVELHKIYHWQGVIVNWRQVGYHTIMYRLRINVHGAWRITSWCMGVLVGVTMAQWANDFSEPWWLLLGIALSATGIWLGHRWILIVMFIAGGLVGVWRGSITQVQAGLYQELLGKHVQLNGIVQDDVDTNKRDELVLRLGNITNHSHAMTGEVWVTTRSHAALQRGDHVTVDGKLTPGFGSIVASINNASVVAVQREQPGDIALTLRNDFSSHVASVIHDPAASLGTGYLLGQKRGLPEELVTALKIAGLTHIVVASGYNLTVLVRLARRLFAKVSKFLSAFSSLVMIGGFMAITGLSPSMARAGLVSVLALWAWYYGRAFHPVTLLSLAGAVTVGINPSYAWGNLGWQLSFAAFAGVMIVAPLVHAYFFGNEKPHWIAQILIETVSAQIATLPIILMAFGQLSNVAPLANLMIVPFVPLAMLLVFIAGLAAYIVPSSIAIIIAWPAQTLLDIMVAVVHWCAGLSWAQSSLKLEWWGALLWYALLLAACYYVLRKTRYNFRKSSIVE